MRKRGTRCDGSTNLIALEGTALAVIDRWLADSVHALTPPLVAINCLIDPDAILIGGRLPMALIPRLVEGLTAALAPLLLPSRAKIIPAIMAQDGPAVGAAMLPFLDHLLPSDAILIQAGRGCATTERLWQRSSGNGRYGRG